MSLNSPLGSLLTVSGPDAQSFLQGKITADLKLLTADNALLSSYCNLKGRVMSIFFVFQEQGTPTDLFFLFIPGDTGSWLLKDFQKWAVFSKVNFALKPISVHIDLLQSDHTQARLRNPFQKTGDLQTHDLRLGLLETAQLIIAGDEPEIQNVSPPQDWLEVFTQLQLPILHTQTQDLYLPQALGLTDLNAVSFNKGCYLGQEVIARVHYKGQSKRHLYRYTRQGDTPGYFWAPGTPVLTALEQTPVGHIIQNGFHQGLCVLEERYCEAMLEVSGCRIRI